MEACPQRNKLGQVISTSLTWHIIFTWGMSVVGHMETKFFCHNRCLAAGGVRELRIGIELGLLDLYCSSFVFVQFWEVTCIPIAFESRLQHKFYTMYAAGETTRILPIICVAYILRIFCVLFAYMRTLCFLLLRTCCILVAYFN